jgi:hypothetical protein
MMKVQENEHDCSFLNNQFRTGKTGREESDEGGEKGVHVGIPIVFALYSSSPTLGARQEVKGIEVVICVKSVSL